MRAALFVILCVLLAGCNRGPATGTVKGMITLDAQPVEDGLIRLVPADGNSQPADSRVINGAYSVTMPLGEKKVEIYWAKTRSGAKEIDTASQGTEQIIQMIPAKYNAQTTLTYAVVKGKNVKDFALMSK